MNLAARIIVTLFLVSLVVFYGAGLLRLWQLENLAQVLMCPVGLVVALAGVWKVWRL